MSINSVTIFNIFLTVAVHKRLCAFLNYSHKKRKDSLETQAELTVVRTYVENQAILELQ